MKKYQQILELIEKLEKEDIRLEVAIDAYEQVLELIEKLEKEDIRLEVAIDDGIDSLKDKYTEQEISNYLDKLREQRKEVNIRKRIHEASLELRVDGELIARFVETSGDVDMFLDNKILTTNEFTSLHKWLNLLMEEVK